MHESSINFDWNNNYIARRDWNSALVNYLKVELLEHTKPIKTFTQEVSVVVSEAPTEKIEPRLFKLVSSTQDETEMKETNRDLAGGINIHNFFLRNPDSDAGL